MSGASDEPHGEADFKAMWSVLAAWLRSGGGKSAVGAGLAQYLQQFTPIEPTVLEQRLPRATPPLRLDSFGWVIGGPLPRYGSPVIPVVTAVVDEVVDGRVREFKLRVALLRERDDGSVHAEGWRFESAERDESGELKSADTAGSTTSAGETKSGPPHPYSHAQAIFGWQRDSPCLIHPPHPEGDVCDGIDATGNTYLDAERLRSARATLDTHPAFPLPARTLTGLALAVVATLYGARTARTIVEGDALLARLQGAPASDFALLCGTAQGL